MPARRARPRSRRRRHPARLERRIAAAASTATCVGMALGIAATSRPAHLETETVGAARVADGFRLDGAPEPATAPPPTHPTVLTGARRAAPTRDPGRPDDGADHRSHHTGTHDHPTGDHHDRAPRRDATAHRAADDPAGAHHDGPDDDHLHDHPPADHDHHDDHHDGTHHHDQRRQLKWSRRPGSR